MVGPLASLGSILRALGVVVVVLIGAIVVAGIVGSGLAFLGVAIWALGLGVVAVGALLAMRGRPIAGAGAILGAVALVLAFQYILPAILWTVVLFVGVGLIVYGTAPDTVSRGAWVLLLPRVGIGWALLDNAQDHFRTNWLPAGQGTPFFQIANGAATRNPLWFLDSAYQGFLRGAVVPGADTWAALTICGEMTFGLLLALGLCVPVASLGAMWLHANYMLMKGFVAHGAYTDKVFFLAEAFSLITAAGLVYGLDASLRHHVPAAVATTLMGAPALEDEPIAIGRAAPRPV